MLGGTIIGGVQDTENNVVVKTSYVVEKMTNGGSGSFLRSEGGRGAVAVLPVSIVSFQAPVLPWPFGNRTVAEGGGRQVGDVLKDEVEGLNLVDKAEVFVD